MIGGSTMPLIYREPIPFSKIPTDYDKLIEVVMNFVKSIHEDPVKQSLLATPINPTDTLIINLKFLLHEKLAQFSLYSPSFYLLLKTRFNEVTFIYYNDKHIQLLTPPNIQDINAYKQYVEIYCKLSNLINKLNISIDVIDSICHAYLQQRIYHLKFYAIESESERETEIQDVKRSLNFLKWLIDDGTLEELHWRCHRYVNFGRIK